jgi:hypothetical protein
MDFSSSMGCCVFPLQSALLYNFYHSLTVMQFSSFASKIQWEGVRTVMVLNVLVITSFCSCSSEVVVGEVLNLDIQMGRTKTLGMSWDIIKDKEDLEFSLF